jgi:hypothetical protein
MDDIPLRVGLDFVTLMVTVYTATVLIADSEGQGSAVMDDQLSGGAGQRGCTQPGAGDHYLTHQPCIERVWIADQVDRWQAVQEACAAAC